MYHVDSHDLLLEVWKACIHTSFELLQSISNDRKLRILAFQIFTFFTFNKSKNMTGSYLYFEFSRFHCSLLLDFYWLTIVYSLAFRYTNNGFLSQILWHPYADFGRCDMDKNIYNVVNIFWLSWCILSLESKV